MNNLKLDAAEYAFLRRCPHYSLEVNAARYEQLSTRKQKQVDTLVRMRAYPLDAALWCAEQGCAYEHIVDGYVFPAVGMTYAEAQKQAQRMNNRDTLIFHLGFVFACVLLLLLTALR